MHFEFSIKDHEHEFLNALHKDLGRSTFESVVAETGWVENDIVFTTRHLRKWAKDEKADDIDLMFKFMTPFIRKDPLGCVLIIGYDAPKKWKRPANFFFFAN